MLSRTNGQLWSRKKKKQFNPEINNSLSFKSRMVLNSGMEFCSVLLHPFWDTDIPFIQCFHTLYIAFLFSMHSCFQIDCCAITVPMFKWPFNLFILVYVSESLFVCSRACLLSSWARRGHRISWNWRHIWLWAGVQVLGIKPSSHEKAALLLTTEPPLQSSNDLVLRNKEIAFFYCVIHSFIFCFGARLSCTAS